MTPIQAVVSCFSQYANVKGRASRSEFFWFFILSYTVFFAGVFIPQIFWKDFLLQYSKAELWSTVIAFFMLLYIPRLAVSFRRLHDLNLPSGFYLLALIPIVGQIGLFLLMLIQGTAGPNHYGIEVKNRKTDISV